MPVARIVFERTRNPRPAAASGGHIGPSRLACSHCVRPSVALRRRRCRVSRPVLRDRGRLRQTGPRAAARHDSQADDASGRLRSTADTTPADGAVTRVSAARHHRRGAAGHTCGGGGVTCRSAAPRPTRHRLRRQSQPLPPLQPDTSGWSALSERYRHPVGTTGGVMAGDGPTSSPASLAERVSGNVDRYFLINQ